DDIIFVGHGLVPGYWLVELSTCTTPGASPAVARLDTATACVPGWAIFASGPEWEAAMGAWGPGTLENDTAVDWMYGLGEVPDLSLIEGTLDRALAVGDDYLEAADAEEAIAAAEAVARLLGNFGVRNDYTRPMD